MSFPEATKRDSSQIADDDALLEFIIDNEPNLIFVKDEESRIVYANTAFRSLYPPDERDQLIGSTTAESFTAEEADLFLREDRRALREGASEIVEELTNWEGKKVTLLTRKYAVTLASGERRLVCISSNISVLAERERRLVRVNAQLKSYSNSIAHDLRNPIANIVSGLNLIERDQGTVLGERGTMVLKAARESAMGLSRSITAMLKAADTDGANLSFVPCDLNLLLEEVRFNLSAQIDAANCDLHVARLPTAVVEPDLMRQLFQNLIENSIKYAGVPHIVITIHYAQSDGEHLFYVADNGVGIADDLKERVFTKFVKGSDTMGLGLGLTTCQRIANLHDGIVEIHDRAEAGCCMLVRIPIRSQD